MVSKNLTSVSKVKIRPWRIGLRPFFQILSILFKSFLLVIVLPIFNLKCQWAWIFKNAVFIHKVICTVEFTSVFIVDEDDDKIVLPTDDIKETVTALQCFGYLSSMPIQIFIQLPDKVAPSEDNNSRHEEKVATNNTYPSENSIQKIAGKLSQLEITIQRLVTMLENLST